MPADDESTPTRRGPGRPRKAQAEPKKVESKGDPDDPRIGQRVADARWYHITYPHPDGREYLVVDGVIVEKVN